MPKKSQERLRAWINMNQDTIQGWELGDFLKTDTADVLENTKPRWPGCPDEVMRQWMKICTREQKPLANGDDNMTNGNDNTQYQDAFIDYPGV